MAEKQEGPGTLRYCETLIAQVVPGKVPAVLAALKTFSGFGVWTVEIGALNRVFVLRASDNLAEFDRVPPLLPIEAVEHLQSVERTRWRALGAGMKPPGAYGGCHEWRCYDLLPGRGRAAADLFLAALPAREALSPLLCVLESIDGPERIAHLWPYASLDERGAVRARGVASGVWPPAGFAALLSRMNTEILLPASNSAWS